MPSTKESTQGFISNQCEHSSSTQTVLNASSRSKLFRSASSVAFDGYASAAAAPRPAIDVKVERHVQVTSGSFRLPDNTPAQSATVTAGNRTSGNAHTSQTQSQVILSSVSGAPNDRPSYLNVPTAPLHQEAKSKLKVHPALLLAPSARHSIESARVKTLRSPPPSSAYHPTTRFLPGLANSKLLTPPTTTTTTLENASGCDTANVPSTPSSGSLQKKSSSILQKLL